MVTTITTPTSNFTDRDLDSWLVELRTRAASAFPGWTDYNTPNFGNLLLESFAHTLDGLSYTQDQQHLERFVIFARLRRSMIWLGRNLGFSLPEAEAATVDLEVTIADADPRVSDLVVPAGTVVRTAEGDVEFDLLEDATIPAGSIQVTGVAAENARARSEDFVASGVAGFSVPLGNTPYVQDSAAVTIGVDSWTEVESFYDSGPADRHFRVDVDQDARATLVFGDGTNGALASGAGTATYKTGGGAAGNVEANTLTEFLDTSRFATLAGEQVQVTVRNPAGAGGGVDRMSVEEARVAMPAHVRTAGQRSVTRSDYEDNALKVRGVARALFLTSDDDGSIDENTGRLYVVPVGGGLPSSELKADVLAMIEDNYPPPVTFALTVHDPSLRVVTVSATVYLNRSITEAEAQTAAEEALDEFFALVDEDGAKNERIDFGFTIRKYVMDEGSAQGEVAWSDIFDALRNATTPAGRRVFRSIDEDTVVPADSVPLLDTEFPVLGPTIILTNGDTGLPLA